MTERLITDSLIVVGALLLLAAPAYYVAAILGGVA